MYSSYNLLSKAKLQKHAAFESEIQANRYMLDAVDESGNAMVDDQHEESEYVLV